MGTRNEYRDASVGEARAPLWRVAALTLLAMVAFAANSLLCRMALGPQTVDAASFTTVRLVSGALTLWIIVLLTRKAGNGTLRGDWPSAAMLFTYAVTFSFAYLTLTTGTGALILFGSVQVTMWVVALWRGERPHPLAWVGLVAAFSGLVYLVSPGITAPSPGGAALMGLAGVAWGVYSLRGRGSADPLADTAGNFLRSVPLTLVLSLLLLNRFAGSGEGLLWAVLSGALASGVGYTIWYAALPHLTATRAATVQLSVPVIAAAAGTLVLAETVSMRLVIASVLILGGIGLALFAKSAAAARRPAAPLSPSK